MVEISPIHTYTAATVNAFRQVVPTQPIKKDKSTAEKLQERRVFFNRRRRKSPEKLLERRLPNDRRKSAFDLKV